MFREWREVTQVIISKRKLRRPRYALTDKYVTWAQRKYHMEPVLFRHFGEKKGIINLRNLFLREAQLDSAGEAIVQMTSELNKMALKTETEAITPTLGSGKVLILPVAVVI